jgi:hypothetical protein
MVVDSLGPSVSLYGFPRVTIRPESALDCRRCHPAPFSVILVPRGRRVRTVRGRCPHSATLRPLVGRGALCLLRCRCFKQCLQLLAYSPFLGGRRLRTAAQQHGCNGEVLRCQPKEWRGITIGVGFDVRTLVRVSVVFTRTSSSRRRRGAGSRLFGSWTTLLPLAVPLTGLFLHRDHLRGRQRCRLPVAGLWVLCHLALGTKNREPRTESKEPGTGTERTGTEKISSCSVPDSLEPKYPGSSVRLTENQ